MPRDTLPTPVEHNFALTIAASNVTALTAALLSACPEPKRDDIHKLLAVQSYWLNEHGLALLHLSKDETTKNKRSIIETGVRLISESRKTMATLLSDQAFDREAK